MDESLDLLSFESAYGKGGIDPFSGTAYLTYHDNLNKNFDYSLTFSLSVFNGGGVSGSIGYTNGDFRVTNGAGLTENSYALGGSISVGGYGVQYYQTQYGNSTNNPTRESNPQAVGGVGIFGPNWSFKMENDFAANHFKGSGDKWRTGAFELSVNKISVGFSIYTNKQIRGKDEIVDGTSLIWDENRPGADKKYYGAWKNGKVYDSPLWVGYNYGPGISKLGYSNKYVQDFAQNGIHKWVSFGRQNFYNNYSDDISHPYSYNGYNNPYSLYGGW
ncbi:MAG: hypothetical protein IPP32_16705 [Bacteroidetes bacterium]|nr:hypothetical protein [Bacteroidota bacterium]